MHPFSTFFKSNLDFKREKGNVWGYVGYASIYLKIRDECQDSSDVSFMNKLLLLRSLCNEPWLLLNERTFHSATSWVLRSFFFNSYHLVQQIIQSFILLLHSFEFCINIKKIEDKLAFLISSVFFLLVKVE